MKARYLLVVVCLSMSNIRSAEPIKIDDSQPCTIKITCTDAHDVSDQLKNFLSSEELEYIRTLDLSGVQAVDDDHLTKIANNPYCSRLSNLILTGTNVTHRGLAALVNSDWCGSQRDIQQFFTSRPSQSNQFFSGKGCLPCAVLSVSVDQELIAQEEGIQLWRYPFAIKFVEPIGADTYKGIKVLYLNGQRPPELR